MRGRECSRPARGLTLVELLVALTLFALLSVLLFGGLRFGARATAAGSARNEWSAEFATAGGFLRSQLAAAQPLPLTAPDGTQSVAFAGAPERLELVALAAPHLESGEWHTLELRVAAGRLWATLRQVAAADTGVSVSAPEARPLLDHVAQIALAYFGRLDAETPPQWHERWEGIDHLPSLVRLEITFSDGRHAPTLLIAIRPAGVPEF